MMDYEKLAELLFPEITKTPEDYETIYPQRDLPEGAKVTRLGPSPTGFMVLPVTRHVSIDAIKIMNAAVILNIIFPLSTFKRHYYTINRTASQEKYSPQRRSGSYSLR